MLKCPDAENGFSSQASQLGSSSKRSLIQWWAWLITSHTPLSANLPIHSHSYGEDVSPTTFPYTPSMWESPVSLKPPIAEAADYALLSDCN